MSNDLAGEEDEEGKGRAVHKVVEVIKGRVLCGFQGGVETGVSR